MSVSGRLLLLERKRGLGMLSMIFKVVREKIYLANKVRKMEALALMFLAAQIFPMLQAPVYVSPLAQTRPQYG